MTSIVRPTYQNGFYSPTRGGIPAYPQLWRGCVGAWCPSLGPNGISLRDQSLAKNHGTLTSMNPAEDWVISPGAGGGYALDFDGSDYVNCGNPGILKISGALTLSCWVKTSASRYQYLIQKWGQAAGTDAYHFRLNNDGKVVFTTSTNGSYQAARDVTGTTDVRGSWAHVAAVYDGANSIVYVNGAAQASTATTGALYDSTLEVWLGALSDGTLSSNWLQGLLDDARIYNRALTSSEIALLHRLGRGGAYALEYVPIVKAAAAPPAASRYDSLLLLGVS